MAVKDRAKNVPEGISNSATRFLAVKKLAGLDQVFVGNFPTFGDYTSLYVVKSSKK